jgi:hypothetical protein
MSSADMQEHELVVCSGVQDGLDDLKEARPAGP